VLDDVLEELAAPFAGSKRSTLQQAGKLRPDYDFL
jgi:hypothetical protein